MKDLDYENLFIYMSLIFAVCIFIIILYGCAFANPTRSNSRENSIIFENFFADDDKRDIKTQVLSELQKLEKKTTISAENKKIIKESIDNIFIEVSSGLEGEQRPMVGFFENIRNSGYEVIPIDGRDSNINSNSNSYTYRLRKIPITKL